MLSILIPVYNQYVVPLVKDLLGQCERSGIAYQILVFDDKSDEEWKSKNESLHRSFGVNYVELSENIGRARIRNRLGRMARYEHLLFLDGDSEVVREDFISTYLSACADHKIIYGGRVYQDIKPTDLSLMLHWKYGKEREALPVDKRIKLPFLNFQSNNFLIKATLFEGMHFDEEVVGYGYEDLLYAERLKEEGQRIAHIDNPVLHGGLEPTGQFLAKTINAVENLASLNKADKLLDTRLTTFYTSLDKNMVLWLVEKYIQAKKDRILQNLNSDKPSIRQFSLFKLGIYIEAMQNQSK